MFYFMLELTIVNRNFAGDQCNFHCKVVLFKLFVKLIFWPKHDSNDVDIL